MPSPRILFGFLGRFALLYGLLIIPWPGFNAAYARFFRGLGDLTFAHESGKRLVRFEPVPAELHHVLGTRIVLANRDQIDRNGNGLVKYLELDTRGVGWVPTALLVALVLASPVSLRRRCWALLWGLGAVHGFVLLSVAVYIWNNSAELHLLALGPIGNWIVAGLTETLTAQLGASFLVPVLIWALATLRWQDFGPGPAGRVAAPAPGVGKGNGS